MFLAYHYVCVIIQIFVFLNCFTINKTIILIVRVIFGHTNNLLRSETKKNYILVSSFFQWFDTKETLL